VGRLTLIDFDHVAESNLNRQVQAGLDSLGKAKTDALAARLAQTAPTTTVACMDTFLTAENASAIRQCGADFFIDACDDLLAKQAFILQFSSRERPRCLVVCGAAGGKCDPGHVAAADLAESVHDPLLSKLRYSMRKNHGLPRQGRMHIPVVFSREPMAQGGRAHAAEAGNNGGPGTALACSGYGSTVLVTATMGLRAAALALTRLTANPRG
jgi:tRNA A37 threonylcarbamoyladenosine dehydratase